MRSHSSSDSRVLPDITAADLDVLLNRSSDEFFVLDDEGCIVYANARAAEVSGLPREEMLGRSLVTLIPDLVGSPLDGSLREVQVEQATAEFAIYDSRNQRPASCRLSPFCGRVGVWIVAPDETVIDRHEDGPQPGATSKEEPAAVPPVNTEWADAPGKDRELLEQLIDAIPVMVAIWDPNVQVLRLNRMFEQVLGWTSEDARGSDLMEKCYPDPDYREEVRAFMQALEPGWREFEVTAKSGETISSSWANLSLSDDRRVGIGIDLRERKRTEERLRKMNATLEKRVQQRTAELEQRARELQSFAYVASHDLQEPIRKIRTFAGLMMADYGDQLADEPLMFLDRMLSAATRMQELMSDLLEYSRVATRPSPIAPVDLQELVDELLQRLDAEVAAAGAYVEIDAAVHLEADRQQLRQALGQLLHNAVKFRREGIPPRVSLSATLESALPGPKAGHDGNVQSCRIVVADNGIGFDAEKYGARIFEPFERLHGRGRYEGTGMGLAICRRIVERHGGSITVESTPGEGSRFVVRLPLRQD